MENSRSVVLACIDGSSVCEAVSDYACWIAKKVNAPLQFLHTIEHQRVVPESDLSGAIGLGTREDLLDELTKVEQERSRLLIEKGQVMLRSAEERAQQAGVASFELSQRHGTLAESLVELEEQTRVLVLGIRGEQHENQEGISAQLESIIRTLHRPILVVNKAFSEPKKIMLAYDGGKACLKAIDMLISSDALSDRPCHLVHVGDKDDSFLQEPKEKLEKAGISVNSAILKGKIDEALTDYQSENDIDLMLMGAYSHSRVHDLLWGSFTAKILKKSNKPLLLLR
ncbi:MAG: universal stress protein [Agarilytica sp.]